MLRVAESTSSSYAPRTWFNARQAQATIAFAIDPHTRGELLTRRAAGERYHFVPLDVSGDPTVAAREVFRHMARRMQASTLNVAGNGIYTLAPHGLTQAALDMWIFQVLGKVHEHHAIEQIFTGGQTGVDLAGAVAGVALGIDVTVTLPRGFKQRDIDGVDRDHTRAEIEEQIAGQAHAVLCDSAKGVARLEPDTEDLLRTAAACGVDVSLDAVQALRDQGLSALLPVGPDRDIELRWLVRRALSVPVAGVGDLHGRKPSKPAEPSGSARESDMSAGLF